MANRLDIMDLKQIINLHLRGVSNRQIASTLGLNRNTVNHHLRSLRSGDLSMEELVKLDNGTLEELFSPKTTIDNDRFSALMSFFGTMHPTTSPPWLYTSIPLPSIQGTSAISL